MVCRENAQELASAAREMGARVLRGPVRYGASGGSLHVGDAEIDDLLHEMAAQEVLVIVAPLGLAPEPRLLCPLCRGAYQGGECPVCRAELEEAKRSQEERLLFDEGFSGLLCW
jgi:hypothetical protein